MKSLIWYVHLVFGLLFTIPKMLKLKTLKKNVSNEDYHKHTYGVARNYARSQVGFTGSTIDIEGAENVPAEGAVLFVSNHQSNFDIGIFLGYIDREKGFIAKMETLKVPILRTWMREINCVFMDRSNIKKAAKSIADGIQLLKSGHCMVVFPEGTRSKCAQIGEFKSGSFKLATKAKVPIVPVTMNGTYKIMEENGNKIKAAHVHIVIHPIVPTADLSPEEITALPERLRGIIMSGLTSV